MGEEKAWIATATPIKPSLNGEKHSLRSAFKASNPVSVYRLIVLKWTPLQAPGSESDDARDYQFGSRCSFLGFSQL